MLLEGDAPIGHGSTNLLRNFQILDDLALGGQGQPIPEIGFECYEAVEGEALVIITVDSFLSENVSDPLRSLDLEERVLVFAGLGASEKVEIFPVARGGPARTPTRSQIDAPTTGRPAGEGTVPPARTGRGGNTEGAKNEAAEKGRRPLG